MTLRSGLRRAVEIVRAVVTRFPRHAGVILRQAVRGDAADYYTFVGTDLVNFRGTDDPRSLALWLNVGYWKSARTYDEACSALAARLGEVAELGPNDEVLDVGFGFGDQDFLWLETFQVKRIVGVNITPLHVDIAQRRAKDRRIENRILFEVGSATNLTFPDASFDKIVSLEAACHFRTRESFFAEAFRTLRPDGRLALTDVIPLPSGRQAGLMARLERRFNAFPEENLYDRNVYAAKLLEAGFVDVSVTSIRNDVFPGMAKFIAQKRQGKKTQEIVIQLTPEETDSCAGDEIWAGQGLGDYVMVSATKPAAGIPMPRG
jgi:microcystin synthetase protein McyJ